VSLSSVERRGNLLCLWRIEASAIAIGVLGMEQQEESGFHEKPTEVRPPATSGQQPRKLHRLRDARLRQGHSVRYVAQRLGQTTNEVRAQEEEHSDITISELYRWQAVLDVPIEELINDPQDTLSTRVQTRARLLKVMKTAMAIRRKAEAEEERNLVRQLIEQLIEIMPELKEVTGWPATGHRRTTEDLGRIAQNPISDDWIHEAS
jgi:transcriptional regulator with XRE-family HTH domain